MARIRKNEVELIVKLLVLLGTRLTTLTPRAYQRGSLPRFHSI